MDSAAVGSKTLSFEAHGTIDITEMTGKAMVLVRIRPLLSGCYKLIQRMALWHPAANAGRNAP